jgi:hypothetical protein
VTNDLQFIESLIGIATKLRVQHLQVGDVTVVLHPTAWFPPEEPATAAAPLEAKEVPPKSLQEELGNPELSEEDLYGAADKIG